MIKVVADTNVYISAILFGGKSEKIRKLAREGKVEISAMLSQAAA